MRSSSAAGLAFLLQLFPGLMTRMKMFIMALCGNYRASTELTMERTSAKQGTVVEWTAKHLI